MIITCPSCDKKFEIDATLIPDKGRTLECGSCSKQWFFRLNQEIKSINNDDGVTEEIIEPSNLSENIEDDKFEEKGNEIEKSSNFNLTKILSYLLVGLISFAGIIIILDTFKSQLSNIFPGLELFLYNLFETIKDIFLFIKDLSK